MTNLNYYLWLSLALGPSVGNIGPIFETFKTAKEIYNASDYERKVSGVFKLEQIEKLADTEIEDTYPIIAACAKNGVDIITCHDDEYPKNLLNIPDFPIVLFVKGDLSCLDGKLPFAIVGTRKPTGKSYAAATETAKALSQCGFLIVSGGALGVDSAAHTGALLAGEKTICVLGTGILSNYLKINEPLREVIAANGAVISEFMPYESSTKWSFLVRNRIISGICEGVFVVEAEKKSGSLNTAGHAGDQGRDVFAMPGSGEEKAFFGCDKLIKDGAKTVITPLHILTSYAEKYPEIIFANEDVDLSINLTGLGMEVATHNSNIKKLVQKNEEESIEFRDRKKPRKREIVDPLSDNARRVYEIFGRDPLTLKEIADAAIMPTSSLLGALTELELFGYIELLPNTKYLIK